MRRAWGWPSTIDLDDVDAAVAALKLDTSVGPVRRFVGGTAEARRRLDAFIEGDLAGYGGGRNEPADWRCSFMSPYLHFGQISPVEIALAVRVANKAGGDDRASYLEELIVRRELSMNFAAYNRHYDRTSGVPEWARRSLAAHAGDRRAHLYDAEALARAETHDPYWNAAMREMVHTGFMHNYMRMYWAKKILEWSADPESAFHTTLTLNNRYFLDGRDANSYANVAWCFGMHDRAWTERPVFGKIRYMNAAGLERKFDMRRYGDAVGELVAAEKTRATIRATHGRRTGAGGGDRRGELKDGGEVSSAGISSGIGGGIGRGIERLAGAGRAASAAVGAAKRSSRSAATASSG